MTVITARICRGGKFNKTLKLGEVNGLYQCKHVELTGTRSFKIIFSLNLLTAEIYPFLLDYINYITLEADQNA